jgi:BirA family biotin operon repressor/biotin-[acetyl-CoA-carboxylase] ligase
MNPSAATSADRQADQGKLGKNLLNYIFIYRRMNLKAYYSDFDPIIYKYDTLTSTQTEAKRLALSGIQKAIVVAKEQTHGKGRCGRNWESPQEGGLYVSFLIKPTIQPSNIHLINFVAGLAVASHLKNSFGINAALKWPNDVIIPEEHIMSNGAQAFSFKKICGILSEASSSQEEVKFCIVGIGINCKKKTIPTELLSSACALDDYVGSIDYRELLIDISNEFFNRVRNFELEGKNKLLQEYVSFCSTIGKVVQIHTGEEVINGTAIGIRESGELLVETKNGIREFSSADVFHAAI